jgi:hypothetical protein
MLITDLLKRPQHSYPHFKQVLHNGINSVFSKATRVFRCF